MPTNVSALIYDLTLPFRLLYISEIYMGPNGTGSGRVVPNVDDAVLDWNNGLFRVIAVDNAGANPTYTPTLVAVDLSALSNQNSNIGGLSLYQPSILEQAFLNTAVSPYGISIDDRYRIYGTDAVYAKLFKGSDLSINGVVLSQTFNGSNVFITENITLEAIDPTNPAIKRPVEFNCSSALLDGETVTLVIYNASGIVTGIHPFLIKNTDTVRGLGANTVYITDVVLVSTMLDPVLIDMINAPANTPISGGDFQARLLYNDGTSTQITIDGQKCLLYGINSFNTSLAGASSEVTLTYLPGPNEPTLNTSNPLIKSVSHIYNIRTVDIVNTYSFKIYVAPTFNALTQTYSNDYYLTNLAGTVFLKIPPQYLTVTKQGGGTLLYTPNSGAQVFNVSLLISDVIPVGYTGYRLVQSFTITYLNAVNGWLIDYLNTNIHVYGANATFAYSVIGQTAINISSGALSLQQWLALFYDPLNAMYDQTVSLTPPAPTHFQLVSNGVSSPIRAIADYWNINLPNDFGVPWVEYAGLTIVFYQQQSNLTQYNALAVTSARLINTLV